MNVLLLSSLSKHFLTYDQEETPSKELFRLNWPCSTLAPSPISETIIPKLPIPKKLSPGSYRPAYYFYRGKSEKPQLPYLLVETHEWPRARPVPANSILLRSLCKGKGRLQQNQDGLTYLDVDDRFILSLIPYLRALGLVQPPYFSLFAAPYGAHVPVIPAREQAFQYLPPIQEIGKEFSFIIEGLYSIEPANWPEVQQVWFFKLYSPDLEKLRRNYFLPATPSGNPFHIVVAIQPRIGTNSRQSSPLMRINPGCTPV